MEHKRISLIVSILLLILLSACQMTGVTPAPQLPGAGIIENNPGGPIQLAPTSTTPTAAPTASSGCNQLGCPYPAVCDKTSGVCTINQAQGPGAAHPRHPELESLRTIRIPVRCWLQLVFRPYQASVISIPFARTKSPSWAARRGVRSTCW